MKVGYIGLGKLGLPVALGAEARGYEVKGYDPAPSVMKILERRHLPYMEEGAQELLEKTKIDIIPMRELVRWADLIFVAVQTPHSPGYEGETPVREGRDFDYGYLITALTELSQHVEDQDRRGLAVSIISTCLPGTFRSQIKPELSPKIRYVYNPYFIAMGTTIDDFYNPEFLLLGTEEFVPDEVLDFYDNIVPLGTRRVMTDPTTAELIKMSYNTYIGQKIIFANTIMEMAEKINADVDTVSDAIALADRRLISPAYLRGGMGDGGGCHPRDNVALWYLADQLKMSHNIYEDVMQTREDQTRWLADFFELQAHGLPMVVLGDAYKPETNLTIGSPSRLLVHMLRLRGHDVRVWDPYSYTEPAPIGNKAAFFIGTKHQQFKKLQFPEGSVVVDPWRYMPNCEGVKVLRIGERRGYQG